MTAYHLAQVNIARMLAPLDSPIMAEFVAQLDEINALADHAPGFVWRHPSASGDAYDIRIFDDDLMLVNLSVWESVEALFEYTYHSAHVEVFRQRRDWFEKPAAPILVLWWVPAGHIPTVDEAQAKLEHLRQHGATPQAFTFKERFTVAALLAAENRVEP